MIKCSFIFLCHHFHIPLSVTRPQAVSEGTEEGMHRCVGLLTALSSEFLKWVHSPHIFGHNFAFVGYETLSDNTQTLRAGSLCSKEISKCVGVEKADMEVHLG